MLNYIKKNGITITVLSVLFIIILILTYNDTWCGDSSLYRYICTADGWSEEPLTTIGQLFTSQNAHYFKMNGRYVNHCFVQLFTGILGQTAFAFANAIVYVLYLFAILKYAGCINYKWQSVLTTALLMLISIDTEFSPPCQIGYVWTFLMTLSWLLLLKSNKIVHTKNIPALIGLFVLSIIIGNSHESINIGVAGAIGIYALMHLRKLTTSQWVMFIGFGIGILTIILSPGSYNRAHTMNIPFVTHNFTLANTINNTVFDLRAVYILLCILAYKLCRRKLNIVQFYKDNAFEINVIIILSIFNLLLGVSAHRQWYGVELMCIILILREMRGYQFNATWMSAFTVLTVVITYVKYVEEQRTQESFETIKDEIAKADGDSIIFVDITQPFELVHPSMPIWYRFYIYQPTSSAQRLIAGKNDPTFPLITVYPKQFKEMLKEPVENRVLQIAPGEYMVIKDKNSAASFSAKRRVNLFGLKFGISDQDWTVDSTYLSTENYDILFLSRYSPIIEYTGVEIK